MKTMISMPRLLQRWLVAMAGIIGALSAQADINWDGDNPIGNFSYANNWYSDALPTWGFGSGNLVFNYRNNSSQTSLYYDLGGWNNINDIIWETTFGAGLALNGNGNGINFNQRVENRSSFAQTVNIPLSGAKNGATQIELNPVNADLTLAANLYNDNNKPYYVYGSNGKVLTIGTALIGNSSVSLTVAQNSTARINTAATFLGDTYVNAGTLRLAVAAPLQSSFIRLGDTSGSAGANVNLDGGLSLTNSLNVRSGSSGAKVIANTSGTSGNATFAGNLYLDADVTAFANSGGTNVFSGTWLDLKNQTLTVDGTGGTTISGVLTNSTGNGKLIKTGSGALTLSAANTFTGGLVVKQGTVTGGVNSTTVFGNGAIRIGDSATGANAAIATADGVFPNSVAGTITVDSGAGTRSITGQSSNSGQSPIFSGGVILSNTLTLGVTGAGSMRMNGVVDDQAGTNGVIVDASGSGVVRLAGANTFDGGVIIKRGTLEQNTSATALGTGTLTIGDTSGANNATLSASGGGFTAANAITVTAGNTGNATINGNAGSSFVYSGAVTLNHSLTLAELSTGSLRLSGAITGGAGVNYITNSGSGAGGVTLDTGVIGNSSGTVGIVQNSATSSLTLNGANTYTGGLLIKAGTVSCNIAGGLGATANVVTLGDASGAAATLVVNGASGSNAGNIDQPVTVSGTGVNTISGTWNTSGQINLLRGLITLNSQNLTINSTAASGWRIQAGVTGTGNLNLQPNSSGGIDLRTVAVNHTGAITNSGTGTGVVQQGSATSIGANVTSLIQNSTTSAWNVNQANGNFAGTAQVLAGTMRLQNASALSVNNVVSVASGATLDIQNVNQTLAGLNDVSGSGGAVTDSTAATTVGTLTLGGSGSYSFSGILSATTNAFMAVAKSGAGTQTLAGNNTYAGGTTISGGTLKAGHANALGAGTVFDAGGTLDLNGFSIANSNSITATSVITNSSASAAALTSNMGVGNNLTIGAAGDITVARLIDTGSPLTVTKTGAGVLTFNGAGHNNLMAVTVNAGTALFANTGGYTADRGVTLNGGTIKLGGTGSGGAAPNANLINDTQPFTLNGGTFDLNGWNETVAAVGGGGGVILNNATGTNSTLTLGADNGSATYPGSIQNGGGALAITKSGSGIQTLSGANSYGGGTTINAGTLRAGSASALGGGAVTNAGATLDLNGYSLANASYFTSPGTLTNSSASAAALTADATLTADLTVGAAGDITTTRLIGMLAPRTITKTGAGTLTTSGTSHNNLAAWVINAGKVVLANTSGYGADRGVTINSGTLQLSGANFDLINDGQAFTVNGGVFDLNGKNEAVACIGGSGGSVENDAVGTAGTLYVGGGVAGTSSASFAGVIQNGAGTLALTKEGSGTQTLSGNNTYTGNTLISSGALALTGSGSISNTPNITLASGAALDVSGLSTPFALGVGQKLAAGSGTGMLAGNVNLASGSLALNYTNGTAALLVTNGTLSFNSNAVTVTVSGTALPAGSYKLIAKTTGGAVNGTLPSAVTVNGSGATAGTALQVVGSELYLVVGTTATALISSANPAGYLDGITFTASVQTNGVAAANATGSVTFYNGAAPFSTNSVAAGSAISDTLASLPRGTNLITAIYSGDVNYLGSTNSLNQVVTNHPPVAGNISFSRNAGIYSLRIIITNLLASATDADGDTLSLMGVSLSTNGITLPTNATSISYYNTNNVADQFSYTVGDGHGGTATGVVTLNINPSPATGQNATVTVTGNTATLVFYGVPDYSYVIQRKTNLLSSWVDIATNAAGTNGIISLTDAFVDLGSNAPPTAFYRLRQ